MAQQQASETQERRLSTKPAAIRMRRARARKREAREKKLAQRQAAARKDRIYRLRKKITGGRATALEERKLQELFGIAKGGATPSVTLSSGTWVRTVWTYADLVEVIRDSRIKRGLTQAEMDAATKMPPGYTSHIEAPEAKHGRYLGLKSMHAYLKALGLLLRVEPDPSAPPPEASDALKVGIARRGPRTGPSTSNRRKRR